MPTTSLTLDRKFSLYESLLFNVFEKLTLGSLQLELPGGHTLYFGNGTEVKARIRVLNNEFFVKSVLYGDIGSAIFLFDPWMVFFRVE